MIVGGDAVDHVVEQAVELGEAEDAAAVDEPQTVAERADPEQAVVVLVDRVRVTQQRRVAFGREIQTAVPIFADREDRLGVLRCRRSATGTERAVAKHRESARRGDPERAVAIAIERADDVAGQTLARRPGVGDAVRRAAG